MSASSAAGGAAGGRQRKEEPNHCSSGASWGAEVPAGPGAGGSSAPATDSIAACASGRGLSPWMGF